jgi:AraC-like DNA-binding protein
MRARLMCTASQTVTATVTELAKVISNVDPVRPVLTNDGRAQRPISGPRPDQPGIGRYFERSTERIARREQREFWRDTVLNRSDVDFPPDPGARGFAASVMGCVSGTAELREGRSDPIILRRDAARCRRDGGDEILLSAIVETDRPARYRGSAGEFAIPAGRILVNDLTVPFTIDMARYRSINFRLPRAAVTRSVRSYPSGLRGRMLSESHLVSLLFTHLVRFADALPAMDDAARLVALDATAEFALATMRLETQSEWWGAAEDRDGRWSGLWLAAERFIERNLDRADLNPATIARALRCSRTQLYRLFALHETSVMDHIRDVRLNRCRDMLADPACQLPVADIAALYGMDNPSAFGRGFRQRFGCSPGELRQNARDARTSP